MSKFCSLCGHENQDDVKFCSNCGNSFDNNIKETVVSSQNNSGNKCIYCGNPMPVGSVICPTCGRSLDPEATKEHTFAIVIGYLAAIFFPLAGIIIGIYLLTRKNKEVHKHGIIMMVLAIIIGLISALLFLSAMSTYSNSYYYASGSY